MTAFDTKGPAPDGLYRLSFETDNKEHFLFMQDMARMCVDFGNKRLEWEREIQEQISKL